MRPGAPNHSAPGVTPLRDIQVPPHSIEAEQAVLGGLVIDAGAWDQVDGVLEPEDFYRHDHQTIFRAMKQLKQAAGVIDFVQLTAHLERTGKLDEAGGREYIGQLANNTPSAVFVSQYAHTVKDRALLRNVIAECNRITAMCYNASDAPAIQIIDEAERCMLSISRRADAGEGDVRTLYEELRSYMERLDERYHSDTPYVGTPTGYCDLDEKMLGMSKGDLIILAGRPSMGKTAFSLGIVENVISNGGKGLVFSLEMPGEQITQRLLSSMARVDIQDLRRATISDDAWPRIVEAVKRMKDFNLYIDDTSYMTPAELRSRARRVQKELGGLDLIVVDYLQLMSVESNQAQQNRTAEVSEISRALKSLARELNVPVIALSQLNRSLEQRACKRPVMSDLRESGAIEQDADVILFVYRDEVYNEETPDKGIAEIIIGKQRNGPIGTVRLAFRGQYARFENLAQDTYSSTPL